MITVIILCIVTSVLVITDAILVYGLRILNNKVLKNRGKQTENNPPLPPDSD